MKNSRLTSDEGKVGGYNPPPTNLVLPLEPPPARPPKELLGTLISGAISYPYVRLENHIILLDRYDAFAIVEDESDFDGWISTSIKGVQYGELHDLYIMFHRSDGYDQEQGKKEARNVLDLIQKAMEHWNRM